VEEMLEEGKKRVRRIMDSETFDKLMSNDKVFLDGMRALFQDFNAPNFTVPLFVKKMEFTERVSRRAKYLHYLQNHPSIPEIEIKKPVIILGIFRTGTTMLYNLMSQCDGVRAPRLWEINYPTPPPSKETYHTDPRIERAKQRLNMFNQAGYKFDVLHEINHNWPEECMFFWREENICTEINLHRQYPTYVNYFDNMDPTVMYKMHKLFIQFLSSNYPAESHWLLKSPIHLLQLPLLVETYGKDNIRLVLTHRDPVECIPSTFSLFCLYAQYEINNVDQKAAAHFMLRSISQGWKDAILYLDQLEKEGHGKSFIHVYYDDIVKSPFTEIKKIHSYFDLPAPSVEKMQQWLDENPKGKHGKHAYRLEDYGVTPMDVYEAFLPYYRRFFPTYKPPVSSL